jgi:hypothetical protein
MCSHAKAGDCCGDGRARREQLQCESIGTILGPYRFPM